MTSIQRGGSDDERLYLEDLDFVMGDQTKVSVTKTAILPGLENKALVARNIARNHAFCMFGGPGKRVLDFPCGSGYAAQMLRPLEVRYEGRDRDSATICYARRLYGRSEEGDRHSVFNVDDLCSTQLLESFYDVIGCIEGIEHIDHASQARLIDQFYSALKTGGTLVITTPEAEAGKSGPSTKNRHHLWELTRNDFVNLLTRRFALNCVEIVTQAAVMHTGVKTTMLFAFCHK